MHWRSITWKKGTLMTLIRRAYTVCLSDYPLKEELHYKETYFTVINDYPKCVLKQTSDPFKTGKRNYDNDTNNKKNNDTNINNLSHKIVHTLKHHVKTITVLI